MDHEQHNSIVNFIWGIADDVLRDVYVRGKYRDVILPMTVIRRLDALLEPSKEAVLKMKERLDKAKITQQEPALRKASGYPFYNTSTFTLRRLRDDPKQLKQNFEDYLDGFSPNVAEIVEKFDLRNQIRKLSESDVLGQLIEKFLDPEINLSPEPVLNGDGTVRLPALTNHGMSGVYEELLRRFSEENNEEAGEHFTPRDVVHLMACLILIPIVRKLTNGTYLLYDDACGTGGMLTESDFMLGKLAREMGKEVNIHLYGQEVNPETYAICKSDLLIRGEEEGNIRFGSTLSNDAFPRMLFDFMLANPPYGKSWKTDLDRLCGGDKGEIKDPRFVVSHDGNNEFSLVTRSSDGQLLFLVNMLSKMKTETPLGSRVATVHNGSALFTGDAGQGESNIRQWILENDWLEAIIGLPENVFYNTGIATYIWVLSNRKKGTKREGKVQLIDATQWFTKLRKNLGQKNCRFSDEQIDQILKTFQNFKETEQSKIFDNEDFGYWQITVERPLRLRAELTAASMKKCQEMCKEADDESFQNLMQVAFKEAGPAIFDDYNFIWATVRDEAKARGVKLNSKRERIFRDVFCHRDERAKPVMEGGGVDLPDVAADADLEKARLEGEFEVDGGYTRYEPDPELRDHENVPLKDNIREYFKREVLPHVPDAWIDAEKTVKGYEISFTKYFYKYQPLRNLEEIAADLLKLEKENEGLLQRILAVSKNGGR